MRQLLPDLDPYFASIHLRDEADTGNGRAAASCLQVRDLGRPWIGRKYRGLVLERGKQDLAVLVDHRIGVSSDRLRINVLERGRQIECPATVRPQREIMRNQLRLFAHRAIMKVVGP